MHQQQVNVFLYAPAKKLLHPRTIGSEQRPVVDYFSKRKEHDRATWGSPGYILCNARHIITQPIQNPGPGVDHNAGHSLESIHSI